MLNIHKLENGDTLKILPRVLPDNNIEWVTSVNMIHYKNKIGELKTIFDKEDKWARKLHTKLLYQGREAFGVMGAGIGAYSIRYYVNVLIDGEIKVIIFGRKLLEIITSSPDLYSLSGNHHLKIDISQVMNYPSYDKTTICQSDWKVPVNDPNSKEEWIHFIKKNQPDIFYHFQSNDILRHRAGLLECFESDLISDIISDERDKKINQVLDNI